MKIIPAKQRQREKSPEKIMTQLRIQDLRRVAPLDKVNTLLDVLKSTGAAKDILDALGSLEKIYMSLETLEETNAGILVKKLSKHTDPAVSALATKLYEQWRSDAKAAALRRAKRQSQEAAAAGGGKRRKSGAAADDGDPCRDASRDYMVAEEMDLEAEVAEWDQAAVSAAHKPAAPAKPSSSGHSSSSSRRLSAPANLGPRPSLSSSSSSSLTSSSSSASHDTGSHSSSKSGGQFVNSAANGPMLGMTAIKSGRPSSALEIPISALSSLGHCSSSSSSGAAAAAIKQPVAASSSSSSLLLGQGNRPSSAPLKLQSTPQMSSSGQQPRSGNVLSLVSPDAIASRSAEKRVSSDSESDRKQAEAAGSGISSARVQPSSSSASTVAFPKLELQSAGKGAATGKR